MHLEPPVFRPPSEAFSLILQLTIGCRHNACTFCGSYKRKKYRIKDWEEIKNDIDVCASQMTGVQKVFLADGDALAAATPLILKTSFHINKKFPGLERISMYAAPKDILEKSMDELKDIRAAGVKLLYMGVESGSDNILRAVCKGVTAEEMIQAGKKALQAGFELSVTIINGLGGTALWEEHARETARVISAMNPTYLSALTLMPVRNTVLYRQIQEGKFVLPDAMQMLQEMRCLLEHINLTNCVFRTNHASNYLPLRGVLNRDRDSLIAILDRAITQPGAIPLRPENSRGL
ncbi:radical SAM protein [Desulfoscipio gibsoniae]|uniref:Fe-S oxidoreductase n=1 Tax=Desulfoscipio gibsoniae DSM 7213 TaxID=767817 RepID=R4KIH8_9FIRM|nr:radical SAM protein [Desulfoscipio gibsoniae]AGL01432.1 Fe-S oxidoreductase [Desulfoscipio gibsoniae DSM 7213]